MSAQPYRRDQGGAIDRERPLAFTFDGRAYQGFAGDTLASALLANGVHLVGRSFKYHRPRGVYSAGHEEPNALVTVGRAGRREPNTRATMVELYDGLVAESQNRWPSLSFDVMALTELLSPIFVAGFYYKTFKWPASFWNPIYEKIIRKAAGLGRASRQPDPDRYEKVHASCDVLVAGGGPAGLSAARAAAAAGCRVLLADERSWLGGTLAFERADADGPQGSQAVDGMAADLAASDTVTVLPRTTVFGAYDHNVFGLVESTADHLPTPAPHQPRQRFWIVRAPQVVLATGAVERPLVFACNDLPGVMLASAARAYVNRYAVTPGRRVVVFTNNDSAYRTAIDLADAGVRVMAVVDARDDPPPLLAQRVADLGIERLSAAVVTRALGRRHVKGVEVAALSLDGARVSGPVRRIACDLVCVSGGWTPSVQLQSQSGVKPVYRDDLTTFVPGEPGPGQRSAGSCLGLRSTEACLASGQDAGARAAAACGFESPDDEGPRTDAAEERPLRPLWHVPEPVGQHRPGFVDLQHDVTTSDIALAHREGYVSVEHLKRYTTLGMATDQGKTSNINALGLIAALRGEAIPALGTTTFRPPYTPVTMGALAGTEVGPHLRPVRRSPMHDWHTAHGAVFVEVGDWLRPLYYPANGETPESAYRREAGHVRAKVGMVDISTLVKVVVQGPDAAEFLNRIYVNGWSKLPVDKARYGAMLRDDGIVSDDGTTARISENEFFMTATTAHGPKTLTNMEFLLETAWPKLKVRVTEVTDQWGAMAVAGPLSREVLASVVEGVEMDNDAFPFMGVRVASIGGDAVRLHRVSYSGELAYEVFVPAHHGQGVWERIVEAGGPFELVPYGTEAMDALRIEKGHVAGPELDGRTTLGDLGLEGMASTRKPFVGSVLMKRPGLTDGARPRLVGLAPDPEAGVPRAGALVREQPFRAPDGASLGHVTSVTYSPALGHYIALALVAGGMEREGQTLYASSPVSGENTPVRVVSPVFFDTERRRLLA